MALRREPVRLATVVDEAIALFADEADDKDITIAAAVPGDLEIVGDRTRLRQVCANLIENAVKYTNSGGRIDIEASAAGTVATLVIRDAGIGIAAADLPLIWDRLYRADISRTQRGLGLGLSLVKAVVEAHGGQVAASSQPGQGSTFSVTLPASSRAGV